MLFIGRLKKIADTYPDRIALSEKCKKTTYRELLQIAAGIGEKLKELGIRPEDIVGINISKSSDYIFSMLGIWYAGAAFVPIDPDLPCERTNYILKDAQPSFVITSDWLKSVEKCSLWNSISIREDTLAYLLYTSGSTGTPKGVLIDHSGIIPFLDTQIKAFKVDISSRSLLYLSTNFDASISDIGTLLLSGGTLYIEPKADIETISGLLGALEKLQITHLDLPPSLLRLLAPAQLPSYLKSLIIGGEAVEPALIMKWANVVRLVNAYGPTETTVCSSLVVCASKTWVKPLIGNPVEGTTYLIVDEYDRESLEGELWIGGLGVARGYLNRDGLNAEKFIWIGERRYYRSGDKVRRLEDGQIEFVGRIDRQIKLRGLRIEPEEIETVLKMHSDVLEAAVMKQNDPEMLIAFVTLAKSGITKETLRNYLSKSLPSWMVPARIEIINSMPKTSSGKINLNTLKTELESQLAGIWQKILKISNISRTDHFFRLGADSFHLIEFIAEAEKQGLPISPGIVRLYPVLMNLAEHLNCEDRLSNRSGAKSCLENVPNG